jgi:hypothetical protein
MFKLLPDKDILTIKHLACTAASKSLLAFSGYKTVVHKPPFFDGSQKVIVRLTADW